MVLESLTSPFKAEKKPWDLFFLGFLYASLALLFALWIFRDQAGLVMIFLTVMACVPLIHNTLKEEEEKDIKIDSEWKILAEHSKAITFLLFLFIGITAALTLWYVVLPSDVVEVAFKVQTDTIADINSPTTGDFLGKSSIFSRIFFNNIKVLTFCILFAFFYGAGAIFILTWNASVIATAMGTFIKLKLLPYATEVGLAKYVGLSAVVSAGFLRYMTHGVLEILGYFVGGLAGGIISVAVIRHDFGTKKFSKILLDSSDLLLLSVFILFIAAAVEVYVTPLLF